MIQIYGSPLSSAHRCYWALEELGLEYERRPLDMKNREHKSEAYLRLNPNGKVPCLVEGDFVLWESVAINFYLAQKYRPEFLGDSIQHQALVYQWSLWSQLELQRPLIDMLIQLMFVPAEKRDPQVIEKAKKQLAPLSEILNHHLKGRSFMVGNSFTLADLNLGSVVRINAMVGNDLSAYPSIQKWFQPITQRPAYLKVEKMG